MSGLLGKIFRKRKKTPEAREEIDSEKTQPIPADWVAAQLEKEPPRSGRLDPPQLVVGVGQSIGKVRDHNEDALLALTTTLVSDSTQIPFGFFIVADGMGGHQHGDMASGVATRAMTSHVLQSFYLPLFNLSPKMPEQSLQEILREGVQAAHRAIIKQAPGGGTTLTAMLIFGNQLTIAHVGDSRAYAIEPDGSIQVLTRDHSLVKRLEELGQITAEEAAVHPQRNVLYRALGQGEPFEAEITTFPLPSQGHLLLCSDGLWGVISQSDFIEAISSYPSPAEAAQKLVSAANQAGGPDNITAIIVRLPD